MNETPEEKKAREAREAQRDRDAKTQQTQDQRDAAEAKHRADAGMPAETPAERTERLQREAGRG